MKKKNAIRDSTGSKSDCLSVFFSTFSRYFFYSNELIRVFPSRSLFWLATFFSSSCHSYRRRLSTLLQSSRRRKEENILIIGWLISFFLSGRLMIGYLFLLVCQSFFFSSTWILNPFFFLLLLPYLVHWDLLQTTTREIMPDYTHS